MAKAHRTALESLHDTLSKVLEEAVNSTEIKTLKVPAGTRLETGETAEDETTIVVRTRNASILNVARQFLKDNNIEVDPASPAGQKLKNLAAELPYAGSDDGFPPEENTGHRSTH